MTIRPSYDRWPQYNRRLTETIAALTDEQLSMRPHPDYMPLWAIAGHLAGTRVYWLCTIVGEPGAETTPWPTSDYDGWEDDLSHPRSASELIGALDSSFAIIDRVLDTWTPEDLGRQFERGVGPKRQVHDGSSILQRMFSHDAYHGGELSIGLGAQGMDPVDIWRPY
jgi:uncharacterized damage-inducible protein DinB